MVIESYFGATRTCPVKNKLITGFKFSFLIVMISLITACGGGGSSSNGGGTLQAVSGTAATGIAIDGNVNVYGSNGGSMLDVPVGASGDYSADVTGLTAPFFICAVPDDSNLASQYSYADGPGIANITPMTTLALYYANGDQDPASLISTWPVNQANVTANLPDAQAAVNANFVGVFDVINAALNIDFSTYDIFSTGFNIGDIFDQILDLLDVDLGDGTPVITIDEAPFTFDSDIDISGINIGGATGTLTITGADTSVIGTSFSPTVQTGSAGSTTALVWGDLDTQVTVGGSGTQLSVVTLNFSQLIGGQVKLYSYALTCLLPGDDCGNLQLDIANKRANFNHLQMPLSGAANNSATGSITLNGTLNWAEESSASAPYITSFDASESTIFPGNSVDLIAVFTNGTGAIDNGVGIVNSTSPVSVSPSVTTTYTLTVTNESGSVSSTVTITANDSGGGGHSTGLGSLAVSGADTLVK